MNTKTMFLSLLLFCLLSLASASLRAASGPGGPAPAIVEKGLRLLKTAGPAAAFEGWREGGALEGDPKGADDLARFKELIKPLRNYRSFEVVEAKDIGRSSRLIFVTMSFDRGVLFGKFLVWRSERDWVVQRLEFDTKPETLMPWLAAGGGQ
jgi:hypothetical protein